VEREEETQENLGGGTTTTTTYDYTREWSQDAIDSSDFKTRFAASDANLGGWTFDADTLGRVTYSQALKPGAPAGWTRSGDNYYRGDRQRPKLAICACAM
jgi:transmembrane protein TMEM43